MTDSQLPLSLPLVLRKDVCVDWDGGELSSDGGWLLLALADRQLNRTPRMATALTDPRNPHQVTHPLPALIAQRVYQIAQGYEDANDAQTLRHDPLLKVAVGLPPQAAPLAGR